MVRTHTVKEHIPSETEGTNISAGCNFRCYNLYFIMYKQI